MAPHHFSTTAFSMMTLKINDTQHSVVLCGAFFVIVMLSVIILRVLNVIILNVIMPSVFILNVTIHNVICST